VNSINGLGNTFAEATKVIENPASKNPNQRLNKLVNRQAVADMFNDKGMTKIEAEHYRKGNQENVNKYLNYHTKNRVFQKADVPFMTNPSKGEAMAHKTQASEMALKTE
jgi:hypothetical protein